MQVLLPLKEFAAAKQRLAGVLSALERAQLFEAMVDDVLKVLTAHPAIERVLICSRDRAAAWLARYYQVDFLHEDELHEDELHEDELHEPELNENEMRESVLQNKSLHTDRSPQILVQDSGLNVVVNTVARRLAAQGISELMVVHGDLPLLSVAGISTFIKRHQASRGAAVTIAPDRHRTGTNLLAWRALPTFTARYGSNSFQQHVAQAHALQAALQICDLPDARCDIDEPDDLLLLTQQAHNGATRTLTYLRESGVAARLALMVQDDRDQRPDGGRANKDSNNSGNDCRENYGRTDR